MSFVENEVSRTLNIFKVKYPISPPDRPPASPTSSSGGKDEVGQGRAGNRKSESSCPNASFFTLFYSLFLIFYFLFSLILKVNICA